jgi:hypothetical protein
MASNLPVYDAEVTLAILSHRSLDVGAMDRH